MSIAGIPASSTPPQYPPSSHCRGLLTPSLIALIDDQLPFHLAMIDGRIPGLELKHIPPECLPIWGQKWAKPYRPLGPSQACEHAFWISGSAEDLPFLVEPDSPTLTSETAGSDHTSSYLASPYEEAYLTLNSTSTPQDVMPRDSYSPMPPVHDSTPQNPLTLIPFPSPQYLASSPGSSDHTYLDAFFNMEETTQESTASSQAMSHFLDVHQAAMNHDSAFVHTPVPNNNMTGPALSYDLVPSTSISNDFQPTAAGHQRCRSTGALELEIPTSFPNSLLTDPSNDLLRMRQLSEPRDVGGIRGFDATEAHAVHHVPDHTFTMSAPSFLGAVFYGEADGAYTSFSDPNLIKPVYSQPDPTASTSPSQPQPQRALHIPEFLNPHIALRAARACQHGSVSGLAAHARASTSAVGSYDLGSPSYPPSAHTASDFGYGTPAPIHLDTHERHPFPPYYIDSPTFHGNGEAYSGHRANGHFDPDYNLHLGPRG
ncbi:hypothetical protein CONPUDRAFT_168776 [Coniophora puteana RWD-64-598 SS2]|uniref:Uncharacterized protein n=1 Tax=Coniophora puteana (strain RWD-64-598) TaxID=741705 RepID=A0A5M3MAW5_CONPW|nr:uncharacterized protein CONPUDRAFT_168776 [Coniophora puteana RWD-64-598 SS2]EIW76197.1 hypothetical protein CONPUDRAFT_168776 [Coniophora puteana RWD-64-598 SS2]